MDVPAAVDVQFRRVTDAVTRTPKGHLTLNGVPLCGGDGRFTLTRKTERINVDEFLAQPCATCLRRLNRRSSR